jgi:hypothetical protein
VRRLLAMVWGWLAFWRAGYTFPPQIELDDENADAFEAEIANPALPNHAMPPIPATEWQRRLVHAAELVKEAETERDAAQAKITDTFIRLLAGFPSGTQATNIEWLADTLVRDLAEARHNLERERDGGAQLEDELTRLRAELAPVRTRKQRARKTAKAPRRTKR